MKYLDEIEENRNMKIGNDTLSAKKTSDRFERLSKAVVFIRKSSNS